MSIPAISNAIVALLFMFITTFYLSLQYAPKKFNVAMGNIMFSLLVKPKC